MKDAKTIQDYEGLLEVKFPRDITGDNVVVDDKFDSLPDLLNELDKQVSTVGGSVAGLVAFKENLVVEQKALDDAKRAFEESRFAFDKQMKKEHQELADLKIDFEQEKTKIFNEIQTARELLEKKKREFEKYRQEQIATIERNKKILTKNYEQFEKIVSTFNEKIDKFDDKK